MRKRLPRRLPRLLVRDLHEEPVALADVAPTIAGRLGLGFDPRVVATDRLGSEARTAAERVKTMNKVPSPGNGAQAAIDLINAPAHKDAPNMAEMLQSLQEIMADDVGPLRTGETLAEGVASVHAVGVLHRDVKPSNVLMEGRSPVLIDFGLARLADDPRLTQTGWLLGTQEGARWAFDWVPRAGLAEIGLTVSVAGLHRFFARRGMTRKKRQATPSSRTAPTF